MIRPLSLVVLLLVSASAGSASPDLTGKSPADLVKALGDGSFKTREAAARELLRLGEQSLDALHQGEKSTDEEISSRCRKLLPLVQELALSRMIDRFIEDPKKVRSEDVPGLTRWKTVVGTEPESRKLYAEMARANFKLLLELDKSPQRANELYTTFCQEKITPRANVGFVPVNGVVQQEILSPADLTMFFFLGSHPEANRNGSVMLNGYSVFNNPTLPQLLGSPKSVDFRRLYLEWLTHESNPTMLRRAFQVAGTAKMKEALPLGLKMARDPKRGLPTMRALMLTSLLQLGDKSDLPLLDELLRDETAVTTVRRNNEMQTVQFRDVAMGVGILWAGQSPRDFGFEQFPMGLRTIASYTYFAFSTEEKRKAAHEKWKDWQMKQPK